MMDNDGKLRARAYQLEMFQASMKGNIIVAMGTGSGKTNVACLRIQAELERTPSKRIWFMAPNTVLAEQQLHFLSSQLPGYRMRSLLGHDKVDLWHSQDIWEKALANLNVIVSTPQVLLDALRNAFVRLQDISLLVFDEAHHCQAGSPYARIMETQYHVLKRQDPSAVPHVLGLTASSRISRKTASVEKLETNLDATCCMPTESIEEYALHVYVPQIVPVSFASCHSNTSKLLNTLHEVVANAKVEDDPLYQVLEGSTNVKSMQKLEKIRKKNATPALQDLKALYNNAENIAINVGAWGADVYIRSCVKNWHEDVLKQNIFHAETRSICFLERILEPVRSVCDILTPLDHNRISGKARALLYFLRNEYHKGIAVIIFVERRTTAYALTQLLREAPETQHYRVFSFVGLASSRSASLSDIADRKVQKKAFADFRAGSQDICVETSVAEEGVDIQAVNLVIRFDDPKQFVSFLQSRGRARKQESKFVYFRNGSDPTDRYGDWARFERELEEEYQKDKELQSVAEATKDVDEASNEEYIVQSTGAQLLLENSTQHLQHFCSVIGKGEEPLYIFNGNFGSAIGATVYLPAQVVPELRVARSKHTWQGEKAAKKDAAFQAYKALHEAGLVNDNLVPFHLPKEKVAEAKQKTKTIEIDAELDVWSLCLERTAFWRYRVDVCCGSEKYESITIAVPYNLEKSNTFRLCETSKRQLVGEIVPLGLLDIPDTASLKEYTSTLVQTAFRVGSFHDSLDDMSRVLLLLLPGHEVGHDLSKRPLSEVLGTDAGTYSRPLMLWRQGRKVHYLWHRAGPKDFGDVAEITVSRVSRLQVYTGVRTEGVSDTASTQSEQVMVEECFTRGAATIFGPTVLLLPSMLHFFSAALRSQYALQTVLRSVTCCDPKLFTQALLAKQASGMYNYERLEFLGDAYLKYRVSLEMFHAHPLATEGLLTHKTHALISNARLEEAAQSMELAQYITTNTAGQKHWKLPLIDGLSNRPKRTVNSKLLADAIESLLGATILDVESCIPTDERAAELLRLVLPDERWTLPQAICTSLLLKYQHSADDLLVANVHTMFGYQFKHSSLLHEAFTHSSRLPSHRTLDRLEFLGDAILDFVLKSKLFQTGELDAGRMTEARHALASHEFLAWLALGVSCQQTFHDVQASVDNSVQVQTQHRTSFATDYILIDSPELRSSISNARSRYDKLKVEIQQSLSVKLFPWTLFSQIAAPKICSDIIESVTAAIYIDSGGSMSACEEFLGRLGLIEIASSIARSDDFEVRNPIERLHAICQQHGWLPTIETWRESSSEEQVIFSGKVILHSTTNSVKQEFEGVQASTEETTRVATADKVFCTLAPDLSTLSGSGCKESTEDVEMGDADGAHEEN